MERACTNSHALRTSSDLLPPVTGTLESPVPAGTDVYRQSKHTTARVQVRSLDREKIDRFCVHTLSPGAAMRTSPYHSGYMQLVAQAQHTYDVHSTSYCMYIVHNILYIYAQVHHLQVCTGTMYSVHLYIHRTSTR